MSCRWWLRADAEKVDLGIIAFPPRLKPDLFWATYGATEVAPFQDEDFFNKLSGRISGWPRISSRYAIAVSRAKSGFLRCAAK